jgi:putative hydrolase of the HAD superfamily
MSKSIKAILFDIDDTLYDRNLSQSMILERIVKKLPHVFESLPMDRVLKAFLESDRVATDAFNAGAPSEGLRDARSRHFLRLLGAKEDYADTITKIYVREYPHINSPVDGAVQLVKEASRRFKIGAVSNGLPDVQYRKLETIGIRDAFTCIVLSEEIGIRKPDPRIFQKAADLLGVPSAACLYVGDSYDSDIVGAKAAGMTTCWLCRDEAFPENPRVHTDFAVCSLEKLQRIIERLIVIVV